jgi:GT2 family glycosyltransferase
MSRKRKKINKSLLDIALLSCGLVDINVFEKCLEAIVLESENVNSQIYVYLNGAPKESRNDFENIIHKYPQVRLNQSTERVGFPAGANRVIKKGSSPLVLFITDDIILHKGSLVELVTRIQSDEKIGLCGMKLLFPEGSDDKGRPAGRVQHIGHGIDIRGEVVHPLMGWKPDNPKCNVSREVLSVTGGVFIVRRNAFLRAGGFFEGYGLGYFEDVDLCLTLREQGWKIWIETEAVGTHYTNMSMMRSEVRPDMEWNKMIFRGRKSNQLINDTWSYW